MLDFTKRGVILIISLNVCRKICVYIKERETMRKEYVKPMMAGEEFVANEYVAACWYGNCNISGNVYADTNGNGVYDAGVDKFSYTNTACYSSAQFAIQGVDNGYDQQSDFLNAFVVKTEWVKVKDNPGHMYDEYEQVTTATPVYNYNKHHVSTLDAIVKDTKRPNHS